MSEVPILPCAGADFTIENNVIKGSCLFQAPYTAFNFTDEPDFSYYKNKGYQAFASNMPLTDSCYWIMFIKTDTTLPTFIYQSAPLFTGEFECFFRRCNKPLILNNLSPKYSLPFMTRTQHVVYGETGCKVQAVCNTKTIDYNYVIEDLSEDDCRKILSYYNWLAGGYGSDPYLLYPDWKGWDNNETD